MAEKTILWNDGNAKFVPTTFFSKVVITMIIIFAQKMRCFTSNFGLLQTRQSEKDLSHFFVGKITSTQISNAKFGEFGKLYYYLWNLVSSLQLVYKFNESLCILESNKPSKEIAKVYLQNLKWTFEILSVFPSPFLEKLNFFHLMGFLFFRMFFNGIKRNFFLFPTHFLIHNSRLQLAIELSSTAIYVLLQ